MERFTVDRLGDPFHFGSFGGPQRRLLFRFPSPMSRHENFLCRPDTEKQKLQTLNWDREGVEQ